MEGGKKISDKEKGWKPWRPAVNCKIPIRQRKCLPRQCRFKETWGLVVTRQVRLSVK